VKALAISDKVVDFIYSPGVRHRFNHVDMVISCGDLPHYYLEYIISTVDKPLYYVNGNHAHVIEYTEGGPITAPGGAINLDGQVLNVNGLLIAGFEGSIRYNKASFQYTDEEMRWKIAQTLPRLFLNRAIHGRYLDLLVAHSPPRHVQDAEDRPHQGFHAFRWYLKRFRPRMMLHGHIHVYHPNVITRSTFYETDVINCYGYREIELPAIPEPDATRGQIENDDRFKSDSPNQLRAGNAEGVLEPDP
jgi:predicted phosphodiesterase